MTRRVCGPAVRTAGYGMQRDQDETRRAMHAESMQIRIPVFVLRHTNAGKMCGPALAGKASTRSTPHIIRAGYRAADAVDDLQVQREAWVKLHGFVRAQLADMANPFARLFPGLTGRRGVIESVVARRTFQDVILPPRTRRMLDEALTQVHSYSLIFEEWGLGERHPTGTALAFNFAGPSGTGKTICAEAIAHHLDKRLLLVRYAELESMWFGETPKNVAAIFRMAHEEDAVLFFDEADAVAARRSRDVSQGMQRESNTTVNVMLQELERFDGVVIFATNLAANFDPAFERRIRTHVLFELPGVEEREQIWRVQLHQRTPLAADVNFRELAERYAVSGGDIRNAVLKAALSAAAEDGPDDLKRISQRHFIGAMDEVVLAKAVMRQSLIESPDRQYETALTETRHMLGQMRTAGAVAAAAAGAALLLALIALVVALL